MGKKTRLGNALGASFTGAARLSFGSLTGQFIAFVATIAVARLYSPADVGVLSAVMAVALTLSPLVTLGLQVAIVPAESNGDSLRLAQMALMSSCLFSLAAAAGLVLFPLAPSGLDSQRVMIAVFVPSMVFLLGAFAVMSQVALRHRQYSAMAYRGVAQSATIGSAQVGGYFAFTPPLGLFVGELLGRLVGVISLLPFAIRQSRLHAGPLPNWRNVLVRYMDAIRYFLPATALEMASVQSVFVLVAIWFGDEEAGYVGLTLRVLAVPIVLIGTAVGQVLSTELSHRRRIGEISGSQKRLRRLLMGLTVMALAFAVGIMTLGPWVFKTLYGEQWASAGELARYMAVPMAVGLIWNSMSTIYGAHLRFRIFLGLSAARFIVVLALGFALYQAGQDWIIVVVGMAGGAAAIQVIGIWIAWRLVALQRESGDATYL